MIKKAFIKIFYVVWPRKFLNDMIEIRSAFVADLKYFCRNLVVTF